MEFSPNNNVVKLCMTGMANESAGKTAEAHQLFRQAWKEATHDFEKYIAAYYLAGSEDNATDQLKWYETSLQFALSLNSDAVNGALPTLYTCIARCYEELGDVDHAKKNNERAIALREVPTDKGPFYHGTRADLPIGSLLTPGGQSNYKAGLTMNHIYFTALANGAGLAAALAKGEGRERVYIIEPTGSFENDPNVTDKKFPGNPSRSYRSPGPLRIVGELTDWDRITAAELQKWKHKLDNSNGEIIN